MGRIAKSRTSKRGRGLMVIDNGYDNNINSNNDINNDYENKVKHDYYILPIQ